MQHGLRPLRLTVSLVASISWPGENGMLIRVSRADSRKRSMCASNLNIAGPLDVSLQLRLSNTVEPRWRLCDKT